MCIRDRFLSDNSNKKSPEAQPISKWRGNFGFSKTRFNGGIGYISKKFLLSGFTCCLIKII